MRFWNVKEVKAFHTDTLQSWLPPHQALKIDYIPPIIIQLLVDYIPQEIAKKDEERNFPLHVIISNSSHSRKVFKLVDIICFKNTRAAAERNDSGNFPLYITVSLDNGPIVYQLIDVLFEIYPDAA